MNIFPVGLVADFDAYTIKYEPIASIDLMERACVAFVERFLTLFPEKSKYIKKVDVFVGPGNNGGDGLAIARMLAQRQCDVCVHVVAERQQLSKDALTNLGRLETLDTTEVYFASKLTELKRPMDASIVIDALFGAGLNRPLSGWFKQVVQYLNGLANQVVSVDLPSGMMGEDNGSNDREAILKSDHIISFQFPKLAFFLSENESFIHGWEVVDIGLHPNVIAKNKATYILTERDEMAQVLKARKPFAHKGHFGHALLLAGSYGKMGAAVLAAKACLKSGAGLLTAHVPQSGYEIMQISVPEAMVSIDRSEVLISEFPDLEGFSAIGFGPGVGIKPNTQQALIQLFAKCNKLPLVIDADGVNSLAENKTCMAQLPPLSILTPHPGEFDRLAGKSESGYERLMKAQKMAMDKKVIIVLKGAYTAVIGTDGTCYFNPTGNAGMATAGSGDCLTGILLGLLSQGYAPIEAARLGVYLHGLSGDRYTKKQSMESLIASDLINGMGKAFKKLSQYKKA